MRNNLKISPIAIDDLNLVSNLLKSYLQDENEVYYFVNIIKETINGTVAGTSEKYVAAKDVDNEVVGILGYRNTIKKFLPFTSTPNSIEIYALFVDKDNLKKGIGKNLIEYLKDYAKNKGYSEILVRSAYRFKDSGWKFYERLGFQLIGIIEEKPDEHSNIYRLEL